MAVVMFLGATQAAADGGFKIPNGLLLFTVEQHPGKGDWVTCSLRLDGNFGLQTLADGTSSEGQLTEKEAGRIIEECGKICDRAGKDLFPPDRLLFAGGALGNPLFIHMTPQGELLLLSGPEKPPPPELTAFLRLLWQKLHTQPGLQPLNDPFAAPAKP